MTAAAELVGRVAEVTILESDAQYVGGISRTVEYNGFRFDIGGHRFFSKNPEIVQWWLQRLPKDFITVKRKSRILYKKKFFDYPLRPVNALRNLGICTSLACVCSYLRSQLSPLRPEKTFEHWVSNRFGRRLFDIFFKTYTEKVWGMPCNEISADWASQRIKGLSMPSAIWNSLCKRPESTNVVKTLIDTFQYPRLGPGMMWEKTKNDVLSVGAAIHMGRKVKEILHHNGVVTSVRTETSDGAVENWSAQYFISSMPLQQVVLCMRPKLTLKVETAALDLKYRDFITVALIVKGENLFTDNWIYVHDPDVKVGRVQNFNNWSRAMVPYDGYTCLGLEYFCSIGDGIWEMENTALAELAKREAAQIGLISESNVIDGCVIRMERAYPVYDKEYQSNVSIIRQELAILKNFQVIGRNGMHKYNNQDHSMMTGILAAKNVLGENFDVWRVNTDAEYLEAGEIYETGRITPQRIGNCVK